MKKSSITGTFQKHSRRCRFWPFKYWCSFLDKHVELRRDCYWKRAGFI